MLVFLFMNDVQAIEREEYTYVPTKGRSGGSKNERGIGPIKRAFSGDDRQAGDVLFLLGLFLFQVGVYSFTYKVFDLARKCLDLAFHLSIHSVTPLLLLQA